MRYNFIFFGFAQDFYQIPLSELNDRMDVVFDIRISNGYLYRFLSKIQRLIHFAMINDFIEQKKNKTRWRRYSYFFYDNKPLCFIFSGNPEYYIKNGFFKYCRKKYKDCRIVYYNGDLIDRFPYKKELIKNYRSLFDSIVTFDMGDSKKYNLIYCGLFYSPINVPKIEIVSDVYFVGKAKDRYDKIIKAYEILKANGLKCEFHITEVPTNNRLYPDEISYGIIPYKEVINGILRNKCILEIKQNGGFGGTMRVCEAIVFDKKLISDNQWLLGQEYYDTRRIQIINHDYNIDCSFINSNSEKIAYEKKYKEALLPSKFLELIESIIE